MSDIKTVYNSAYNIAVLGGAYSNPFDRRKQGKFHEAYRDGYGSGRIKFVPAK